MKVVLAPDSFKESMSAAQAVAAMARGVRTVLPDAECVEVPMADGGEGTADALVAALGGQWRTVASTDALGRPIEAAYGLSGGLAVVEVAAAVGIGLVAPAERDVARSSSLGVADLIRDALGAGATRLVVGLGGSATTDGGAGLLAGLGVRWLDADGNALSPTPAGLAALDHADVSGLDPRLAAVAIELACDVTNPLLGTEGAAAVFGPQKGATPGQVPVLDATLARIADALVAAGLPDVRDLPGSGAAGGLGAAFLALGARMRRGVEVVAEAAHLEEAVAGADLVLTGEGSLDRQTLSGKTPAGVADVAARHGVPVIAFAGRLGEGSEELLGRGFAAVVSITTGPCDLATALAQGPANLERAVATALRLTQVNARTP
ncbi:MAG: glycerate kinase [Actinobacteria bacterium HGW-Actinobacteria-5]|jgi:glycerate kinase|nr:MAG: glycerate kinase [Actinobacteria bacterium HGW-Actinobacteria-5]